MNVARYHWLLTRLGDYVVDAYVKLCMGFPIVTDSVPVRFQYGVVNDRQYDKYNNMMARISVSGLEEFRFDIP